jgi:hypothetical protein
MVLLYLVLFWVIKYTFKTNSIFFMCLNKFKEDTKWQRTSLIVLKYI